MAAALPASSALGLPRIECTPSPTGIRMRRMGFQRAAGTGHRGPGRASPSGRRIQCTQPSAGAIGGPVSHALAALLRTHFKRPLLRCERDAPPAVREPRGMQTRRA